MATNRLPIQRNLRLLLALLMCSCSPVYAELVFPELTDRVVDQANILDANTTASLISKLKAHKEATSNQVIVVTVPDLQGYPISDFTNQLARHWGIGHAERNNGVVFLVAPQERKVRIEVGYGLEGALTDATSADIIRRQILPRFREDDYAGGIEHGVDNILSAIKGEYVVDPDTSHDKDGVQGYFPLVFIALIAVFQIFKRFGRSNLAIAAFPAGMVGIIITAHTQNIVYGILASVVFFLVFYFLYGRSTRGKGASHHSHQPDNGRHNNNTSSSAGGIRGGGGSFGGGGASGSW